MLTGCQGLVTVPDNRLNRGCIRRWVWMAKSRSPKGDAKAGCPKASHKTHCACLIHVNEEIRDRIVSISKEIKKSVISSAW